MPGMTDLPTGLRLLEKLIHLAVEHKQPAATPQATAQREATRMALDEARAELWAWLPTATGPLGRLRQLFGLDAFEMACLLLALAPETDTRYPHLLAFLQDEPAPARPRLSAAMRLLLPGGQRRAGRLAFGAHRPLRRWRLIHLVEEANQPLAPLASLILALDRRIAHDLLETPAPDEALAPHLTWWPANAPLDPPPLPHTWVASALPTLTAQLPNLRPALLRVNTPSAGLWLARHWAQTFNHATLMVDVAAGSARHGLDLTVTLAVREAALHNALLVLARVADLPPADQNRLHSLLTAAPLAPLAIVILPANLPWPGYTLPVPDIDFNTRRAVWATAWQTYLDSPPDPATLTALAGKFNLSADRIALAAQAVRQHQQLTGQTPAAEQWHAAARAQSAPILSHLARKVTPHYTFADLVVPPDVQDQLRELSAQVEHRAVVYDVWGFGRKLAHGKGLIALFTGEPGTGKTLAAQALANELGLDLYKIDLSGVVSKYIGETEKNLSQIFAEAENANAILFFDEADALFGKRSEVKDAHDRYANIETAYLLQRMEEYAGVIILATNLKMNLDEAFLRRMHAVVDFPLPDVTDRERLWRGALTDSVPLSQDVDLTFLARAFKISGGNIRNIILFAAFLAAAENSPLGMKHLVRATRREFQKIGRLVSPADFKPYDTLLH